MLNSKYSKQEEKAKKEIKRLKKKNRRLDAILLIGVLQITSLALCYYLGHSHKKDN